MTTPTLTAIETNGDWAAADATDGISRDPGPPTGADVLVILKPQRKEPDMTTQYFVQLLVVKEVAVSETDELQAERAAYRSLPPDEAGAVIACRVLNSEGREDEDGNPLPDPDLGEAGLSGALYWDDQHASNNFDLVRKCFRGINLDWVTE